MPPSPSLGQKCKVKKGRDLKRHRQIKKNCVFSTNDLIRFSPKKGGDLVWNRRYLKIFHTKKKLKIFFVNCNHRYFCVSKFFCDIPFCWFSYYVHIPKYQNHVLFYGSVKLNQSKFIYSSTGLQNCAKPNLCQSPILHRPPSQNLFLSTELCQQNCASAKLLSKSPARLNLGLNLRHSLDFCAHFCSWRFFSRLA